MTDFLQRHLGLSTETKKEILDYLNVSNEEDLISKVIPEIIRSREFKLSSFELSKSEEQSLQAIKEISNKNIVKRSLIGKGYYNTFIPKVILRNILENPSWYTQYTPYQPEIAQGRLEALFYFQTIVCDLTGLDIANASLLDEATAAAEAAFMAYSITNSKRKANKIFISDLCHPQNIAVITTRAKNIGIEVVVGDHQELKLDPEYFAAVVQYPATNGEVFDYSEFSQKVHSNESLLIVCADPMALVLLKSPKEFDADIVIGSMQRFGVPLGFGGPHAGYIACKDAFKRSLPGRLVGQSKDTKGRVAYRLALQTREQHIRREKATSNICTAQVLLAVIATMYAVWWGEKGLKEIARRIWNLTSSLRNVLLKHNFEVLNSYHFDTISFKADSQIYKRLISAGYEVSYQNEIITLSLDECSTYDEIEDLALIITRYIPLPESEMPNELLRKDAILTAEVFNKYKSESEMLRYIKKLENKDLSLVHSMIPLGSCTMKLNATSEMIPVTWNEFSQLHPFTNPENSKGYQQIFSDLEKSLAELTGFSGVSLQPNAGSQGEYAGLLAIKEYFKSVNSNRDICLIPKSAHGTNPASAVMAGMKVVIVECDSLGNIDLNDFKNKAKEHKENLAACMITYPSTHGVFEETIKELCSVIHENGGLVYLDGANFNALVGLVKPADFGADVMHFNLHKTFCIPHGGGGPGVGPIAVIEQLIPFLPGHPELNNKNNTVSAAPFGSASILVISWMYMKMMGLIGMQQSTIQAIMNANYIAKKLSDYYPVLYKGKHGFVAHECILDCRGFKSVGVEVEDIAKRLMDYGFHAPTVSWPVAGTLMIEPTESESKDEIDRFISAMISIREEIKKVEDGIYPKDNNPLKNAPHVIADLLSENWERPYTREVAAYPIEYLRDSKFWPSTSRIDGAFGDRNLVCSCS